MAYAPSPYQPAAYDPNQQYGMHSAMRSAGLADLDSDSLPTLASVYISCQL